MRTIVLHGASGLRAMVDDEDYSLLARHKWYPLVVRDKTYVRRNLSDGGTELMHHLVIGRPRKGYVVDHINDDGLDNRKGNLRYLLNGENIRRRYRDHPYSGIYYSEHLIEKPWKAEISFAGKGVHVGYFHTQEDARKARDTKLEELLAEADK